MRKSSWAVATAVLAVAALPAAPAVAHPTHHYAGSCSVRTVRQDVTGPKYVGTLSIAYRATTADGDPEPLAAISGRCEIRIDGTVVATVSGPGIGVAAAATVIAFENDDQQLVEGCEVVVVAGDVHDTC